MTTSPSPGTVGGAHARVAPLRASAALAAAGRRRRPLAPAAQALPPRVRPGARR